MAWEPLYLERGDRVLIPVTVNYGPAGALIEPYLLRVGDNAWNRGVLPRDHYVILRLRGSGVNRGHCGDTMSAVIDALNRFPTPASTSSEPFFWRPILLGF